MGQSWGHHQFNQGSLTCNSAIDSWESVGGPQNACRLVAAAIKTCRVARYLCQDTHPRPTSFVADVYLERVLDILWYQYKAATGSPYTSQTISRTPASTGSLSQTHTDTNSGSAKNNTTPDLPSESCANPSGLSQAADASTESQIAEQPKVPRASQTLEARLEVSICICSRVSLLTRRILVVESCRLEGIDENAQHINASHWSQEQAW